MARAMLVNAPLQRRAATGRSDPAPAMVEAIRYLVELAVEPTASATGTQPDSFYGRAVWVIELCERLRERERVALQAAAEG